MIILLASESITRMRYNFGYLEKDQVYLEVLNNIDGENVIINGKAKKDVGSWMINDS